MLHFLNSEDWHKWKLNWRALPKWCRNVKICFIGFQVSHSHWWMFTRSDLIGRRGNMLIWMKERMYHVVTCSSQEPVKTITSLYIITARKWCCGKVMFLQVSVILFTGGGGCLVPGGVCSWGGCLGETPTATSVGSMHPTGMHSCYNCQWQIQDFPLGRGRGVPTQRGGR